MTLGVGIGFGIAIAIETDRKVEIIFSNVYAILDLDSAPDSDSRAPYAINGTPERLRLLGAHRKRPGI